MKCAFGENPKGCYGQGLKKSPMTRMAVAALLRELLFKTRRYRDDKLAGKNPPFDMKLEAMLPVINGEIPLKCHAHRADDILTAVRIAKEFGVKATLDHCTDGELISDELAKEGLPVFVGPTLGGKSKAELRHKSFTTPGALYHAGLTVSIITDAPVIPLEKLPMCAGLAANAGLPMEEAWRAITINPARSLGIDSRVGSLEPGKDADLVVLAAAIEPDPTARKIASMLTASIDTNDFITEAHPKLRPVESPTAGIFLSGVCQGPKDIPETVAQAGAAAVKVVGLLSKDKLVTNPCVAGSNELLCNGCSQCEKVCPYGAISYIDKLVNDHGIKQTRRIASVNEALCQGCGACTVTCPSGAMDLKGFTNKQIMAEVDAICK